MASIATLRDLTEALIESAREEGKLDSVTSDLEDFFKLLSEAEEIRNILWSSTFEAATRTIPGARWREDEPLLDTVVNLTEYWCSSSPPAARHRPPSYNGWRT